MVKHKNFFSDHSVEYRSAEKKKITLSLSFTALVMIVEIIGGLLVHSIALISDAAHMFTHCFALGISLMAIIIARQPPCHHKTFGLYRAEILAAFINGVFLLLVVAVIIYEAVLRIIHPVEVLGFHMLIIAVVGLAANLVSIVILHGFKKEDLNIRSVFFHMVADAVSSVGIVMAAIVIYYTGWNIIDPLVSIGISIVIIFWALGILKESSRILLEMAPKGLNIDMINDDLKTNFPEIKEIDNVHLWTITTDILVFSAHLKLKLAADPDQLISRINKHLSEKFKIIESTVQIASVDQTEV